MTVPPTGITAEAWQEAISAGFHATDEASRREVEDILAAAVPTLGLIPAQRAADRPGEPARTTEDGR